MYGLLVLLLTSGDNFKSTAPLQIYFLRKMVTCSIFFIIYISSASFRLEETMRWLPVWMKVHLSALFLNDNLCCVFLQMNDDAASWGCGYFSSSWLSLRQGYYSWFLGFCTERSSAWLSHVLIVMSDNFMSSRGRPICHLTWIQRSDSLEWTYCSKTRALVGFSAVKHELVMPWKWTILFFFWQNMFRVQIVLYWRIMYGNSVHF